MSIPERMIVSATVKSRIEPPIDEAQKGWSLELDVPVFKSKYPTKVTRVSEAWAKLLPARAAPYSVVLLRQNLKTDKTGAYYSDYFWGLEGMATPQEEAAKAVESATPQAQTGRDLHQEAAWALNQGREFAQFIWNHNPPVGELHDRMEGIAEYARWFVETKHSLVLEMSSEHGNGIAHTPRTATVEAKDVPQDSQATQRPRAEMVTVEEVVAWAKTQGYPDKRAMAAIPGVTEAMRGGRYSDAVILLEEAKEKHD